MPPLSSIDLRSIRIDREQQETIFSQLCQQLRDMVLSGKIPFESRLPSTRILASEISVSRITVREAYEQLVAEGFLVSAAGKGTFVSHNLGLQEAISLKNSPQDPLEKQNTLNISDEKTSSISNISSRAKTFLSVPLTGSARESLPFNPAIPDLSLFPTSKWNSVVKKSLLNYKYESMDYGDPLGFPKLRGALAHYLRLSRGIRCDSDQIIITASSEQTIRRAVFMLLDPNDSVWFGEPGIYSRRYAFTSDGAKIMTVPVDDEGVVMDSIYQYGRKAKLAYVLPYRHYPLGITMSLSRRLELLRWAEDNNSWILEDDFSSELGLTENSPPPIQSLDTHQRVIYMGGFSLTLFPALRLSYVVYPKSLLQAAKAIARSEMAVSTALQPALADFIAHDHYISHIRNMRKTYRRREKFLIKYLSQHLGADFLISGVGGGTNIVLNMPTEISDIKLSQSLANENIIAYSIPSYYLRKTKTSNTRNALILGFACSSRDQLQKSADILIRKIRDSGQT